VQTSPLDVPIEISRIRRGSIKYWAGGFINDGLVHWSGIDLDRMESISVERRIYDKGAVHSRPFGDPVFSFSDQTHIARKAVIGDYRVELEVVTRWPISYATAEAWVCLANATWKYVPPGNEDIQNQRPQMSDTLMIRLALLDGASKDGQKIEYYKDVISDGPLSGMDAAIFKEGFKYEWPMSEAVIDRDGGRK
jgi:hypothetical protein